MKQYKIKYRETCYTEVWAESIEEAIKIIKTPDYRIEQLKRTFVEKLEVLTQVKPNELETQMFETFRFKYKGKKRGLETELTNFTKHTDWRQVLPKLERMDIKWGCETKYIPHLATFINQRRWEMVDDVKPTVNPYGEQHNWSAK